MKIVFTIFSMYKRFLCLTLSTTQAERYYAKHVCTPSVSKSPAGVRLGRREWEGPRWQSNGLSSALKAASVDPVLSIHLTQLTTHGGRPQTTHVC